MSYHRKWIQSQVERFYSKDTWKQLGKQGRAEAVKLYKQLERAKIGLADLCYRAAIESQVKKQNKKKGTK